MFEASPPDYDAMTKACALVEPEEDGKLALTGTQAAAFLNGQVSNDIEALAIDSGCYAALLTNKGKMLADLRVLRVGEHELLLLTERATLQVLFDHLRRGTIGWEAELHKRTLEQKRFVLIGPTARAVVDAGTLGPDEHDNHAGQIGGRDVLLIATDVGVEVLCDAGDAELVRSGLFALGALPISEAAAEVLRVERGRPRYGLELNDGVIPQEAGLNERAVSFTKGCYVGQETVARLHYRGSPNRRLVGLRLEAPADPGAELTLGERVVGTLGSVALSPMNGPVGLAIVRNEAAVGDAVAVGDGSAVVVDLPF